VPRPSRDIAGVSRSAARGGGGDHGAGSSNNNDDGAPSEGRSIQISGFGRPITAAQIEAAVGAYGSMHMFFTPITRDRALVTYGRAEEATAALEGLNGRTDVPEPGRRPLHTKRIQDMDVIDAVGRNTAQASKRGAATTAGAAALTGPQLREAARLRAAQEAAQFRARRQEQQKQQQQQQQQQQREEEVERMDDDRDNGRNLAFAPSYPQQQPSQQRQAQVTIAGGRHVVTLKNKRGGAEGGSLRIVSRFGGDGDDGEGGDRGGGGGRQVFVEDNEDEDVDAAPTLTLDQLFRKTVFAPALYWLPLTEQEIADKKRKQQQEKEERERRANQRRSRSRSASRSRSRSRSPQRGRH